MDYITSQTPDKGVQIGPEPPISNDSIALTPDKGVQIGPELLITNASTALTPDKGVQIGPEPPIDNYNIAMEPDKGVQVGPEPPISNGSIAMTRDTIPGFAGNFIEAGIVLNGTKSAVYKSIAYPANADGTQRPGAVVEYSSEFSVGEGFSMGGSAFKNLTLDEALALANLPDGGGKMSVSLPWEAQLIVSGVPDALKAAADKGWTITIQYREPEADNAYYNKYAECVTIDDMKAINADYKNDLTEDGEWIYPTPKMYDLPYWFSSAKNLKKFKGSLPASRGGFNSFSSSNMTYFNCDMPNMQDGGFYLRGCPLSEYYGELPSMTVAPDMFAACVLDKASVIRISSYLKTFTSGNHQITLGIHIDHQNDEEVLAAIAAAETKGWIVTAQWNGTATAQTASTFGLRKPPIYAKVGSTMLPDGTTEQYLDWGHYVTNAEANGYMEFSNVEAATEYWGVTPYVDPDAEEEFSQEL